MDDEAIEPNVAWPSSAVSVIYGDIRSFLEKEFQPSAEFRGPRTV